MRRTLVPALAALVLAAAGCGGDGGGATQDNDAGQNGPTSTNGGGGATSANAADGRTLFADKCGSCHTLAAAETSGTFGPNLDELKPTVEQVKTKVEHGGGGMPAGLYEGQQLDEVAQYVASSAGQ